MFPYRKDCGSGAALQKEQPQVFLRLCFGFQLFFSDNNIAVFIEGEHVLFYIEA